MPILSSPKLSVSTTDSKGANYSSALIALAVLYFMMGFITCLNDSLVPFFKAGFDLTYSQSSLVQFYFFLTYGIISIPAGKVVERIGFKNGMVAGFAIAAVGALLFYPASVFHVYYLFLSALFILAIGIVLLQVSANPYITVLGRPETASSRLTLIQGVGSIGTTVAPLFGAAFILSSLKNSGASSVAVRMPYLGIATCLVVIAIIVMQLKLPIIKPGDESMPARQRPVKSIFSFRNLNFGIVAIFMYVGAEVSIGTFLTNYISDKVGIAADAANHYVAFYWGGMLVGRFFGSIVLRSVKPWIVLTSLSILSVVLILASLSSTGYIAIWTMIAVGVCNSVMFAIIFSLSVSGLSAHTTQASGLLSTAIVGGAVVSFIQGLIKDHYSWQVAFLVPVICYLYILFYGISGYKSKYCPHLHKKSP
jgi:MFS transporter, FHS family, L-fucose permease